MQTIFVGESNFKEQTGRIAVLDADSGSRRFEFGCDSPITCIACVPELCAVACGERSGQVSLWDIESRAKRWSIPMAGPVTAMSYCLATKRLAAGCKDGSVRIWTLDELSSG
mmetsp:Transcript_79283/g.214485  ORF Transcript_79283/g.214485 Transcript_79283/m.214485 type:complete len:112 (-) Transcript_79283:48-383(-)